MRFLSLPLPFNFLSKDRYMVYEFIAFSGRHIYPDKDDDEDEEYHEICSQQIDGTMKHFICKISIILGSMTVALIWPTYQFFSHGIRTTALQVKLPFIEEKSSAEFLGNFILQCIILGHGLLGYVGLELCSIYNTFLPTNYTNEWTYHETTIKIVCIKFNGVFLNEDDRHLWNILRTIATQQKLWSIVSWDWSFHLERAHTLMATTTHTTHTHKPIAQIHPNRAQSFQSDNVQASSASQPMRMLQSTRKRNTERECETNVKSSSTREAHLIA